MLQQYLNQLLIKLGFLSPDKAFIVREEIRENSTWSDLRSNRIKQIKDDLESGNISVDDEIIESTGQTLLTQSIVINRYEIFTLCLLYQSNLNQKTFEGMTPLHMAASLGRFQMLQSLCQQGANWKLTDSIGMTPLDRAKLYNFPEIIEYLQQLK